jgi:glycosyltransferase involved in cell wall biosynthesis
MKMRLLFVTTSNLTTNPRLLKELKYFSEDYQCSYLGFKLGNWSDKIEPEHQKTLKIVQFHYLSATRNPYLPWLWATFIKNFARKAYPFFSKNLAVNAFASDKRAFQLHSMLKKLNGKYDLVMAHNLGALYPAWSYSKKHNIPFIFDIEDYHPGEKYGGDSDHERKRRERLMKNLLPEAALVTYASPLIGEYSLKLVGEDRVNKHLLINNSFHSSEFKTKQFSLSPKLKLVWFSQNIDRGRGLEDMLSLLDEFSDQVELHLIGNARIQFTTEYLKHRKYLKLHSPMPQPELHALLSSFDVGLALENKTQDFNRDICLTNKIWAYFQSGLYILATETQAQRQFLSEKPWAGEIMGKDEKKKRLSWLIENKEQIRKHSQNRFEKAKSYAWEAEGAILHEEISQLFHA